MTTPVQQIAERGLRLGLRRCMACGSWMGLASVRYHECHRPDPIIDALLTEYARILEAEALR